MVELLTTPGDKGHGDFAESKIREIVENNSKARQRVMQLRRQLMDLEKEAQSLGIVDQAAETTVMLKNSGKYRALTCFRQFLSPFRPPLLHSICLFVFPLKWKERKIPCCLA